MDKLEYSWLFTAEGFPVPDEQWVWGAQKLAIALEQDTYIVRVAGFPATLSQAGDVRVVLNSNEEVESTWKRLARERKRRPNPAESCFVESRVEGNSRRPELSGYAVFGTEEADEKKFFLAQPNSNYGHVLFASMSIRYRA